MKNIRTFEQFINESKSLAKPKKFKKKTGPLTIQVDANDVEIDASAVWGQFAEGPMYIYPNDESWDNMLDAETDKNAKKNLKILMAALKKCLNAKGDIIADDKAIKNLDDVMDNLDNMGWENSGGHFFGAEMYNGWQHDDHGSGNVTDAMIASALYAYAKIESFLWWKSENKKNESVNERIELTSGLETVDNFGKVDTFGPKEILKILQDPGTWTDDQQFMDKAGNVYHIDDLLNKEVKVGGKVFTIVEN